MNINTGFMGNRFTKTRRILAFAIVPFIAVSLAACGSSSTSDKADGTGPITLAMGKDTSGWPTKLVGKWNKGHADQKVTLVELPESSDDQRTAMVQDLQTGSGKYDLLATDVNWTAEFAARKWIEPLDSYNIDTSSIIKSTLETGTYQDKLYAFPYTTNAEMLFYRTDLVKTPPTTWDELIDSCKDSGGDTGCYAGQFARYEGLTVNFLEILNTEGGELVDSDGKVTVNTPEAKKALNFLSQAFKDGTIPQEAITYKEEESRRAFQQGHLVYLNNWPYVWALAQKDGSDSVVQNKVGVTTLPSFGSGTGASTLGGYNLAINAASKNKQTAVNFIKYAIKPSNQKEGLLTASNAPVVSSVYEDKDINEQLPYIKTLKAAIESAKARPALVRYPEVSQAIQDAVYPVLQGKSDVDTTLSSLQTKLESVIAQD